MPQAEFGTVKLRVWAWPMIGPPNGPVARPVSRMRQGIAAKKSIDPAAPGGAKYPLMSMIRSVASLAKTEIAPPAPTGTMAAFAVTAPGAAFSVETTGSGNPAGQVVRKPTPLGGTTVMFREYAWAVAGMPPQGPDCTGKFRVTVPTSAGPPKVPVARRVSATRQGVTG